MSSNFSEALVHLERCKAIAKELHNDALLGRVLNDMSVVYVASGDIFSALETSKECVELRERAPKVTDREKALCYDNCGSLLLRYDPPHGAKEAEILLNKCVSLCRVNKMDALLGTSLANLGEAQLQQGHDTECLRSCEESLILLQREGRETVVPLLHMCNAYMNVGKLKDAERCGRNAFRSISGNTHPLRAYLRARVISSLGKVFLMQGNYAGVVQLWSHALLQETQSCGFVVMAFEVLDEDDDYVPPSEAEVVELRKNITTALLGFEGVEESVIIRARKAKKRWAKVVRRHSKLLIQQAAGVEEITLEPDHEEHQQESSPPPPPPPPPAVPAPQPPPPSGDVAGVSLLSAASRRSRITSVVEPEEDMMSVSRKSIKDGGISAATDKRRKEQQSATQFAAQLDQYVFPVGEEVESVVDDVAPSLPIHLQQNTNNNNNTGQQQSVAERLRRASFVSRTSSLSRTNSFAGGVAPARVFDDTRTEHAPAGPPPQQSQQQHALAERLRRSSFASRGSFSSTFRPHSPEQNNNHQQQQHQLQQQQENPSFRRPSHELAPTQATSPQIGGGGPHVHPAYAIPNPLQSLHSSGQSAATQPAPPPPYLYPPPYPYPNMSMNVPYMYNSYAAPMQYPNPMMLMPQQMYPQPPQQQPQVMWYPVPWPPQQQPQQQQQPLYPPTSMMMVPPHMMQASMMNPLVPPTPTAPQATTPSGNNNTTADPNTAPKPTRKKKKKKKDHDDNTRVHHEVSISSVEEPTMIASPHVTHSLTRGALQRLDFMTRTSSGGNGGGGGLAGCVAVDTSVQRAQEWVAGTQDQD